MTTHFKEPSHGSALCNEPVIFVGAQASLDRSGLLDDPRHAVMRLGFADLDAQSVARSGEQTLIAPLFCAEFDAIDLGARLHQIGFRGTFRPMCRKLPNPRMVVAEIRSTCPGVTVDLLQMGTADVARELA